MGVAPPASSADDPLPPGTVRAENYTRTVIYQSPQLPPRYTAWVGAWIMPDQSLMTSFTQAAGPLEGRTQAPANVLALFGLSSLAYDRDFSGLNLSSVYLRSTDDGATWNPWRSDSFLSTAPHGYSGQAVMGLADGTILRRVNGWDNMGYSSAPGTAYLQRLAPGATDWSEPQILMDPSQYTYQFSRLQRLSDGRIIATGNYWRTPAGTQYSNVPVSDQGWLLMVSADEGLTWTNALTEPANPADRVRPNEWDVAELDNGDLLAMMRTSVLDSLGRSTPVRRQALLRKQGDGWVMEPPTATPFAPSGHPELLATREGPVLYIATNGTSNSDGGIFYTRDRGATWTPLDFSPQQTYQSAYYPISLETQDGVIHVFGHRGADDAYRADLDQAIIMDSFRLDTGAPPPPAITSGPPSATPDTTADFAFTTQATATASCALDDAGFADCTSPVSYASLAVGSHTFKVKQKVGDQESAVESRTWTVQTPAPEIGDAPDDPTTELDAEFSFTGLDGATFECSLDGAEFSACTSPATYTGLGAGRHAFVVRQLVDGVASAAVTRRWTITGPDAPTLDTVPASGQPRRSASYTFSGSTGTYECTVDSGTSYAPCTSPMALDGLALGAHTFSARAVDDRGLRSDPATDIFTVRDTVAPKLVAKPAASTQSTSATFSFNGEDPQFVDFTCVADGAPVTPCAPGQDIALTGLAVGDHSFSVSEQLPGADPKQVSFSWTVIEPPPPAVTTGVATDLTASTATATGTVDPKGQDTTYRFEYGLDDTYGTQTAAQAAGAGTGATSVTAPLTGLAPATTYHFRVSATNGSGTVTGVDRTFLTAAAPSTGGNYRQVVVADGPVGYWRLGEVSGSIAADTMGFGPGSAAAGVRLGAVAGAIAGDGAASFDGKTGQVSVPDATRLRTGDVFSLEAWVRPSKLGVTQTIVSKGTSYLLYLDSSNKIVLRLPNVGAIVTSKTAVSDTALWHHVVVTKSGATVRVYLDKVDVTGPVVQRTVVASAGALVIGNGAGGFTGALDEVAVYNKALTAADVTRHYASR